MRTIAIACMLVGLGFAPGCMGGLGIGRVGGGHWGGGHWGGSHWGLGLGHGSFFGDDQDEDEAANRAENQAAELKRQRENAAVLETSKKLTRERQAAPSEVIADPGTVDSGLPERLDSAMIIQAVATVRTHALACGDQSPAKGDVLVAVKVSPDGHVIHVTIKNAPAPGLANCVATAIQQATFPKTQSGGTFRYPFTF